MADVLFLGVAGKPSPGRSVPGCAVKSILLFCISVLLASSAAVNDLSGRYSSSFDRQETSGTIPGL